MIRREDNPPYGDPAFDNQTGDPEVNAQRKPRTLIIEDANVALLIEQALEGEIDVDGRYSGADSVETMLKGRGEEEPPIDLVITGLGIAADLEAGLRVVKAVKDRYPDAHIMLLTMHAGKMPLPDGVNEVFGKPFIPFAEIKNSTQSVRDRLNRPKSPPQGR